MPKLLTVLVAIFAALLLYLVIDEYTNDENDGTEALERAGKRAKDTVEAGSTLTRMGILGGLGLLSTLAMDAMQVLGVANEVLGGAPVILGHLIFGSFALLGLGDVIDVSPEVAGFVFVAVTVFALVIRAARDPEAM